MTHKTSKLALASALVAVSSAHAALNYEISGAQQEIYNTSTVIDSPSNYGNNYSTDAAVGNYAVFDIQTNDGSGNITSDYAQLKVTYLSDNGGVGSNILIAQTNNSQGLEDSGTLSVLMNLADSPTGGSITLQFDWYTFGSFVDGEETTSSSLLAEQINYTALDIDYNQIVTVDSSDISDYTLESDSLLAADNDNGSISFTDDDAQTNVDNPRTAVSFTSTTNGSQQITIGKTDEGGDALFIFEFRDPGTIAAFTDPESTVVPEPATASLLIGSLAAAYSILRRRPKN